MQHRARPYIKPFSTRIRPGPLWALGCFILLASCQRSPVPETGDPAEPDYAAVRARILDDYADIAEAFRSEQGEGLPTTPEEVIARHLEAVGGVEAFDTIQTLVLRFTAHGTAGWAGDLVRYHKKPLHYRQQISTSTRAAVTDGERVWWVGPDGWEEAEGETGYLSLASMDNHLIDPGAVGVTHQLLGVAVMDGDPGFHVRRSWPQGKEDLLFFSAVSGLLTAVRTRYPIHPESWFSYWDYRDLGGIRIPHVMIRSVGDFGPPHGLVLKSVEINVPLPDSLFYPPGEGR